VFSISNNEFINLHRHSHHHHFHLLAMHKHNIGDSQFFSILPIFSQVIEAKKKKIERLFVSLIIWDKNKLKFKEHYFKIKKVCFHRYEGKS